MNAAQVLKEVMEPIGINIRHYTIDYRDDCNNYYNIEAWPIAPPRMRDETIIKNLIETYETKGYTVYGITEIIGNCTVEELEQMSPLDAFKHAKIVYFDLDKERKV